MKRYIYPIMLAAGVLLSACAEDIKSEREKLDERISNTRQLEVSYTVDGTKTSALKYGNKPQDVEILVDLNDSNLVWTLESNRSWCKVLEAEHRGPGKINIEVEANESFEARTPATLTFVAGDFRGFKLTVDQDASIFLLSQPYAISPKAASSYELTVSVPKENGTAPDWNASAESWMTVTKLGKTETEDFETTKVRIDCAENTTASRYGAVTLSVSGKASTDKICISQFGTDYQYDAAGNILFDSDQTAKISFYAPAKTVSSITCPDYVSYTIEDVDEETVLVTITASENFSDCSELRTTDLKMTLTNLSATELSIPSFSQDYVPAHGLLTSKGMFRFAEAVNNGTSTSDWEKDGKVVLLQNIDMAGTTGWTGIGTSASPFKGTFEGNNCTIDGLKGSCGLFGVTDGATIQNITLGSKCSIFDSADYNGNKNFGGVIGEAKATKAKFLAYNGSIEFAAKCTDAGNLCLGGVVGKADASSIVTAARFGGDLTIDSGDSEDVVVYLGGAAGYCDGTLESCECSGSIELSTSESKVYAGGVAGVYPAGATMTSNSFMGEINIQSGIDESHIGGIYGEIRGTKAFDFATDKSVAMGSINVNKIQESATTRLFAGGFAGTIGAGADASFTGYEVLTNFVVDNTQYEMYSEWFCFGGLTAGSTPDGKASKITAKDITFDGSISFKFASATVCLKTLRGYYAGIIAFANCDTDIKSCTNKGPVCTNTVGSTLKNSNSYNQTCAGILAVGEQGNITISDCVNLGNIYNSHYSNRPWDYLSGERYVCDAAGGIAGAFDAYSTSKGGKIVISNCTSSGAIWSYRGTAAGIIAFARNATITKCKASGKMDGTVYSTLSPNTITNGRGYPAGIASVLDESTMTGCTSTSNIYGGSPGSQRYRGAGLASVILNNVAISECGYYGNVARTTSTTYRSEELIGGLVAQTSASCTIKDCKLGGSVDGTKLSENNFSNYITGDGLAKTSGITYWDGQ